MKRILSIILLFICLSMAFQCENDGTSEMVEAEIIFTGLVAADGCGWLLEINGQSFSPVELPESFQKKNITVQVMVKYLDSAFQCGMSPDNKIPQVEILKIKHLSE